MKILVIDDEVLNIEILTNHLKSEGYDVITAQNGAEGISAIMTTPDISLILLDRNMPVMNGIEFMREYKKLPESVHVPIIMQSAVADNDHISEGISSGAYYYLTKPYKKNVLMSIVNSAITNARFKNEIIHEVQKNRQMLGLVNNAMFEYTTMDEAQNLAYFIANSFPKPESVVLGLSEIMLNAVEHGSLGISYSEKSALMLNGKLIEEIRNREALPENQKKKVTITFQKNIDNITVVITDEGNGFNWKDFIEISPNRATDPNGRGIFMARTLSFDSIEYNDKGNEVRCVVIT